MLRSDNGGRVRRVLLDGPYGLANLGDNAIAYCMSRFLAEAGADVTVACLDPDYVERSFGLPAVPMLNFRTANTEVLKKVRDFDAVVIGGGQQLQEHRVPNPLFGMLARVCHMARAARACDVPFIAWSVGMDWPLSPVARFMARRYLGSDNVTLIFRDGKSYDNARSLFKGRDCRILQSKDAVFMLDKFLPATVSRHGVGRAVDRVKRLIVSPSVIAQPEGALRKFVTLCADAAQRGYEVRGWHSEIRPGYDLEVRNLVDWSVVPGFEWLPPDPIGTTEVAALLKTASLLLTTRMHPAIIAVGQGVPSFGIATNAKMRTVFDELHMPYANTDGIEALDFGQIIDSNFERSFAMANAFSAEAARGGDLVLQAVFGKT